MHKTTRDERMNEDGLREEHGKVSTVKEIQQKKKRDKNETTYGANDTKKRQSRQRKHVENLRK